MLKIAMGQFAVSNVWQDNVATCLSLMAQAHENGAKLLVLPEGIIARDINDLDITRREAQPLNGPFVRQLLEGSNNNDLVTIMTIHTPAYADKVWNSLIAIQNGTIIAEYKKIHLYDAFLDKESEAVVAGDQIPPLVDIGGLKAGLMTCYDVRFPELAKRLVLDGADFLVLPAAWVKGPLKESHWQLLVRARALENTSYVIAVSECGPRNIGCSMVVDPLGVIVAQAPESTALVFANIDQNRIAQARHSLPVLQNGRFVKPELIK